MKHKFLSLICLSLIMQITACTKDNNHKNNNNNINANACVELGLNKSLNKIINGTTCQTANSAIVSLKITESNGDRELCSGTIISGNSVITAAHCFSDEVVEVTVGAGNKNYNAVKVIIHPLYESSPSTDGYDRNDIAIVQITETFHIAPIPVIVSRAPSKGEQLIVAGYGTDENGQHGTLKAAYMNVNRTYKSGFVLAYDDTNTNVCFGDSGGPAFGYVNGTLGIYGVTSAGTASDCRSGDQTFFPGLNYSENAEFILNYSAGNNI